MEKFLENNLCLNHINHFIVLQLSLFQSNFFKEKNLIFLLNLIIILFFSQKFYYIVINLNFVKIFIKNSIIIEILILLCLLSF